jgi:carbamoyl-phosphate synthase large subunit
LGFKVIATKGTACSLQKAGLDVQTVNKIGEGSPHIIDYIQEDKIHLVINTLTKGKMPEREGFQIRRASVEHSIPCLTSLDTTKVMLQVLETLEKGEETHLTPLQEYDQLGKETKTWY